MDYTVHGILQARVLEWVAFPFSRGSSQPRDWTQVSHIANVFFIPEPQGKPKNSGVGSLSLLQWIFLTQEWTGVSCIVGRFFTNWAIRERVKHIKVITPVCMWTTSVKYIVVQVIVAHVSDTYRVASLMHSLACVEWILSVSLRLGTTTIHAAEIGLLDLPVPIWPVKYPAPGNNGPAAAHFLCLARNKRVSARPARSLSEKGERLVAVNGMRLGFSWLVKPPSAPLVRSCCSHQAPVPKSYLDFPFSHFYLIIFFSRSCRHLLSSACPFRSVTCTSWRPVWYKFWLMKVRNAKKWLGSISGDPGMVRVGMTSITNRSKHTVTSGLQLVSLSCSSFRWL